MEIDEKTPPVDGEGDKTSSDSSPENKETDTSQDSSPEDKQKKDDKEPVPFNEDPKIQDYINRQVEKGLEDGFQKRFQPKKDEDVKIPGWFGGDADQWKEYQADQARIIEETETRAIQRIEDKKTKEEEALKVAQDWFEENIKSLESDKTLNPTGEKVDRNLLLKTAMDEELIDTQGRWNYKAAYKIIKNSGKSEDDSNIEERKRLADVSASSSNKGEPKNKDFKTSKDFKNTNWSNL